MSTEPIRSLWKEDPSANVDVGNSVSGLVRRRRRRGGAGSASPTTGRRSYDVAFASDEIHGSGLMSTSGFVSAPNLRSPLPLPTPLASHMLGSIPSSLNVSLHPNVTTVGDESRDAVEDATVLRSPLMAPSFGEEKLNVHSDRVDDRVDSFLVDGDVSIPAVTGNPPSATDLYRRLQSLLLEHVRMCPTCTASEQAHIDTSNLTVHSSGSSSSSLHSGLNIHPFPTVSSTDGAKSDLISDVHSFPSCLHSEGALANCLPVSIGMSISTMATVDHVVSPESDAGLSTQGTVESTTLTPVVFHVQSCAWGMRLRDAQRLLEPHIQASALSSFALSAQEYSELWSLRAFDVENDDPSKRVRSEAEGQSYTVSSCPRIYSPKKTNAEDVPQSVRSSADLSARMLEGTGEIETVRSSPILLSSSAMDDRKESDGNLEKPQSAFQSFAADDIPPQDSSSAFVERRSSLGNAVSCLHVDDQPVRSVYVVGKKARGDNLDILRSQVPTDTEIGDSADTSSSMSVDKPMSPTLSLSRSNDSFSLPLSEGFLSSSSMTVPVEELMGVAKQEEYAYHDSEPPMSSTVSMNESFSTRNVMSSVSHHPLSSPTVSHHSPCLIPVSSPSHVPSGMMGVACDYEGIRSHLFERSTLHPTSSAYEHIQEDEDADCTPDLIPLASSNRLVQPSSKQLSSSPSSSNAVQSLHCVYDDGSMPSLLSSDVDTRDSSSSHHTREGGDSNSGPGFQDVRRLDEAVVSDIEHERSRSAASGSDSSAVSPPRKRVAENQETPPKARSKQRTIVGFFSPLASSSPRSSPAARGLDSLRSGDME